jgi:hypothetical protein
MDDPLYTHSCPFFISSIYVFILSLSFNGHFHSLSFSRYPLLFFLSLSLLFLYLSADHYALTASSAICHFDVSNRILAKQRVFDAEEENKFRRGKISKNTIKHFPLPIYCFLLRVYQPLDKASILGPENTVFNKLSRA